ncbi:hypothetical protein HD554DRAFT_1788133 [Boletus coccyginus]|nr:hypothetical protein HD554DRAFT_1788133 [Boletus coccyginus]
MSHFTKWIYIRASRRRINMVLRILSAISAAYISLRLAGISAHLSGASGFPPQVPSLLAGYDNGILYALNPCAFLSRCQQRCGPVYRVSLGSWRLIVISSGDAIASVYSASAQSLRNDIMHREMFYVVAGVKSNYAYLHGVMIRELYPLVDKCLSPRFLGQTTQRANITDATHQRATLQCDKPRPSRECLPGRHLQRLSDSQQKCTVPFRKNVAMALAVLCSTTATTEVSQWLFTARGGYRLR